MDGDRLVVMLEAGAVWLLDLTTGERVGRLWNGAFEGMSVTPVWCVGVRPQSGLEPVAVDEPLASADVVATRAGEVDDQWAEALDPTEDGDVADLDASLGPEPFVVEIQETLADCREYGPVVGWMLMPR